MKVLVLGALFICWWQNSCAAPKWIGAATGDNYDDDLDLHLDLDFTDMELDTIATEHKYNGTVEDDLDLHTDMDLTGMESDTIDSGLDNNGQTSYNGFPDGYDNKEPQRMIVEPMRCTVKPPSLLWIGFTVLRLLIAVWYLSLLGSLSVKKKVSVGPKDSGKPLVDANGDENDARDTAEGMDEVEDVVAILEDLIQVVVDAIDFGTEDLTMDQGGCEPEPVPVDEDAIRVQIITEDKVPDDSGDSVRDIDQGEDAMIMTDDEVPNNAKEPNRDMELVEDVKAVLEDLLQVVVLVHALDQDEYPEGAAAFQLNSIDEQETGDGPSTKPSEIDDLLHYPIVTDMTKVCDLRQDLLDEIGKRSEDSDWTESSSSVKVESSDSSMMTMEEIRKQFLSKPEEIKGPGSEGSDPQVSPEELPPFSEKKMLTKKEWLVIQNWMWAREPDIPSGHRPKVSFTDEVKVKTFLVKKPMHPYDPEEGPSEVTEVEPLKSEGEFQEVGILLTRKCIRHRLLRGISKLKGAFRKKSAP